MMEPLTAEMPLPTDALVELSPTRFAEAIPLFDHEDQPNRPIAFSVLEGRAVGQVYVDAGCAMQPGSAPRTCLIFAPWGFRFLAGELSPDRVFAAESILREKGGGLCMASSITPSLTWTGDPPLFLQRREFLNLSFDSDSLTRPNGYSVVRVVDAKMADRCIWRDSLYDAYGGSVDRLLQNAVLYTLIDQDGTVLSEASAGMVGGGFAEIGVATRKGYEGRNLATATCAQLLLALQSDAGLLPGVTEALVPYWSCDSSNPASAAVARKLGFTNDRLYDLLVFHPKQDG